MIDAAPILKIAPIFAVALISPGPDFMMISSMALSRGRMAGILAAMGIAAGVIVYTVLCLFGLGVIFASTQWLVMAVRIFGGLYLVYLGFQLWRDSLAKSNTRPKPPKLGDKRNPFAVGFLTNMTNPKAMAFFSSIFALTMTPDVTLATEGAVIGVMVLMTMAWFSFVTFGLSTPAMRKVYVRWGHWIARAAGTFLGLFGLKLLYSVRN